jgi:hypothetical protein
MRRFNAVILPALGQRGEGLVSGLRGTKALGLQMKELLVDGCGCALCGFLERGFSTLKSRSCRDDQPTLGHTRVAQRQRLIASVVIQELPGAPLERLAHDLRHHLEGSGHPGDKAQLGKMDGAVFTVECGISDEIAGSGHVLAGPQQRLSSLLKHLDI